MTAVSEWQARLDGFAAERGWERWHTPQALALALAAEVGEVAQLLRWPDFDGTPADKDVAAELGDVAWFLLRLASVMGVELDAALADTVDRNERRFPA